MHRSGTRSGCWIAFAVLLCALFTGPVIGQGVQGSEATRLVRQIETHYGSMRGLASEFEQTYSLPGRPLRRETGRLFLARPHRMRWEYDPRPGKLFIVNERDVWYYVPSDREVTHTDPRIVSDWRFPFLFLLGQSNLRREFRSIELVSEQVAGAESRMLKLVPRRGDTGVQELNLLARQDGSIIRIRLVEQGGGITEISLNNVIENYLAPAAAFEFRPPSGVTVRREK